MKNEKLKELCARIKQLADATTLDLKKDYCEGEKSLTKIKEQTKGMTNGQMIADIILIEYQEFCEE